LTIQNIPSVKFFDIFHLLAHHSRREILELIYLGKTVTITFLLEQTKATPGNFYYHLNFLSPLLKRNADTTLSLTDMGLVAVDLIMYARDKGAF
jgi:DNA-binding transcriptional ArsR family regulator